MSVHHRFTRAASLALLMGALAIAPAFAAPIDPSAPSGPPNSSVSFDSNGHVVQMTPDTSALSGTGVLMNNGGTNLTPDNAYYAPGNAAQQQSRGHMMRRTSMQQGGYQQPNPATADNGNGAPKHEMRHSPEEMQAEVESRIKTLHAKLMITEDQESQWNDVAQAMRDSESNVSGLIQQRHENSGNMTAVDDLNSYQQIAQAHADGLRKVTAAFSGLYNEMTPAQKQNADKVFGGYEGRVAASGHAMHHGHATKAKVTK